MCIIIGAGHGGAPLVFFEYVTLTEVFVGNVKFNFSGSYDDRLVVVGLISVIGQLILIGSYCFAGRVKSGLTIFGCLVLFIATYILTKDLWSLNVNIFSLECFSLFFSLPFIYTALILMTKEVKTLNNSARQEDQNK